MKTYGKDLNVAKTELRMTEKYSSLFPKLLSVCFTHNISVNTSHFLYWDSSVYHNCFCVFSHFKVIQGPACILSLFLSTVSL